MVVRGAASFTDDHIKDELATNFQVLLAGHPSAPLAEYLAVLRKQTMAGYQHVGLPDVDVTVELDREHRKIVVQIHEGASETWPWTLCRESALLVVDNPRYLSVELAKLYASAESGPLCHLVTARLLRVVGGGELSRRFAQRGLERLIAEDFRHDYRLLLDEDTGFGRCALRAAEILRELQDDEAAALGDLFLQNPNAVLTFAIALRQAPPDKIREALPAALDRLWDDGLRERIEWALRDLHDPSVTGGRRL